MTGVDQFPPAMPQAFETFDLGDELSGPDSVDLRQDDYVLLLDIIEHLKARRRCSTGCAAPPGAPTGSRRSSSPPATSCSGSCGCRRCSATSITESGASSTSRTRGSRRSSRSRACSRSAASTWTGWRGIPAPFPKALGRTGSSRALLRINEWLIRVSKGLFVYQIFLVATPRPSVDALLDQSIESGRGEDRGAGLRGTPSPLES